MSRAEATARDPLRSGSQPTMPVLKNQHAAPLVRDAVVLDMGDLKRQAERILAAAEVKAQAVIESAQAEGAAQAAEARAQALEEGRAEGLEQGRTEGLEQGRAEAFEQASQQLSQLQAAWVGAAGQWDADRQAMLREAKQAVVELSLRFAEKLVHRSVEADPGVIVDQVGAALSHVLKAADVSVRICPDDRPLLEKAMPDLAERFDHLKHIHLVDDPDVGRGGCLLTYGRGTIDATIDTQLRRVAEAILPSQSRSDELGSASIDQPDAPAAGTPIAEESQAGEPEAAPRRRNKDEARPDSEDAQD